MTCTLDIYTDYLISSTGPTSATGLSRLYDGAISHDQVTRLLTNSYLESKDLWLQAKPLIRKSQSSELTQEFAVLIIDDSILEKAHTDPNAMITTHWDHSQKRFVNGLNRPAARFVSLLYHLGNLSVPIAAVLIEKGQQQWNAKKGKYEFKSEFSKNEYFRQMMQTAQRQVDYRYLLGDSWYASAENMNAVLASNHHFIFALQSARTVALSEEDRAVGKFQALDSLTFLDKEPLKVFLRSVKQAVLVVRQVFINKDGSQGILYLISNDTSLDYEQITTIYKRRWKRGRPAVEEYHKSIKQNTSMGKSPTKTPDTQANHFYASMLAYIKLEALKLKCSIGHFQLKAQLYLAGLKAMQQQLRLLAA